MKCAFLVSICCVGSLIVAASPAQATTYKYTTVSAVSCQAGNAGAGNMEYAEPGVGNLSTAASRFVVCPLPVGTCTYQSGSPSCVTESTAAPKTVKIYYEDNNGQMGDPNDEFKCYAYATDKYGSTTWGSSTIWTCGVQGQFGSGCTGTHQSQWDSFRGAGVMTMNSPFGSTTYVGANLGLVCFIPHNAGYASWLNFMVWSWVY